MSPALVYCHTQTAGRGQKGNSWESEPGKNITASLLFHPRDFLAARQFKISEAVALALVAYLEEKGIEAKVKWPNDIYVGERKICGILVEHVVTGRNISRTIAGFGLNVNQREFHSDAPNPVSLFQLTGKELNLEEEIKIVAKHLQNALAEISSKDFHTEFLKKLWRHDGNFHRFRDRKTEEIINAKIYGVGQDGLLTLETPDGSQKEYAFKEVEFILTTPEN